MKKEHPALVALSDAERANLEWFKARASSAYGQCVQVASATAGVAMRDSKDPDGPVLLYTRAEFKEFLDGALNGDFDNIGR
jgi:hypothetical protein